MAGGGRSAVLIPFRLPAPLERLRQIHDPVARRGIPAHVTVVFPFVPAGELRPAHRARLAAIARGVPRLSVRFARTASFPGVAYLVPEPGEPLDRLIRACTAAFPEHPPYEGAFADVVPHMTLGSADGAAAVAGIERAAAAHLPVVLDARSMAVYVEGPDERWRLRWRIPLGALRR